VNPNWAWAGILVLGLLTEGWALAMRRDKLQPATYWLRKLPWVVRAGILAWLVQHFLFY
jgi:hypothetical protein